MHVAGGVGAARAGRCPATRAARRGFGAGGPPDWSDIDAERARLTEEGATAVAEIETSAHGRFQVMLDPEDNEFCLVS
ncbi:MAG TPA: VOC family protein [Actinoallomurus sp.]